MSEAELKQLGIKTNAVKRTAKELNMYKKEAETEAARVEKMKSAGADEHDLKQAVQVQCEADMMVPLQKSNLIKLLGELRAHMSTMEESSSSMLWTAALEQVAAAEAVLSES